MSPLLSVVFTAAISNFIIGIFVWLKSYKNGDGVAFGLLGLVTGLWCLINLIVISEVQAQLIRFAYSLGAIVAVMGVVWMVEFAKRTSAKFARKLAILPILAIAIGLPASILAGIDGVVIHAVSANNSLSVSQGPLFSYYSASVSILIVTSVLLAIFFSRRSKGSEHYQWLYVLFGISGFALVSFIVNFLLPLLSQFYPAIKGFNFAILDSPSSLIMVGFSAYAMTKHGLFNVKVILTELSAAVLVLLNLEELISSRSVTEAIYRTVLLSIITTFAYLLTRSVQGEVKRREEIEKLAGEKTEALTELEQRNKNLRALQKISNIVLNESEMKVMAQKILDELPKQLEHCVGGFLSVVRKGELVGFALTNNTFNEKIFQAVGPNLEKYSFPIKAGFNKLHDTLITKVTTDSDALSDFISPPIARPVALTLQKVIGARHLEAFPLYAGGAPFGVLLFVFNASREEIHGKNFEIAQSVADEMSLAIQRAEAFQQLKDANEYLAQLDKMKDEFISMASHELNTPLAAIEGYLSMILDEHMGGKIDAKTKEYLSRAYASSKRLAELILDLLNVSRIEQGRLKMKFAQVNLADLAESVITELQIKADAKKIYLKVEADHNAVPSTWCDPDRIREVFVNLAGNAIKFTDKGGVTIRIMKGENETIVSSVSDTGRGIAAEDQKKLFQKFSQIHREVDEHQGTGLGLYISKNFVELHHGQLSVKSAAGQGATFSFALPIMTEAPKQLEGAILDGPLSVLHSENGNANASPLPAPKIETATGHAVPAILTTPAKRSN